MFCKIHFLGFWGLPVWYKNLWASVLTPIWHSVGRVENTILIKFSGQNKKNDKHLVAWHSGNPSSKDSNMGQGPNFYRNIWGKKNTWLCWIAFVRRCFSLVGDKPSDIKYWVQRVFGQPSANPHDRRDHLYILYNKKYEIYVDSNQYLANPWPIHMFIIVISKSLLHRLNLFLLLLNILKHGQKGRELAKLQLCYIQNQDIPEWIGI